MSMWGEDADACLAGGYESFGEFGASREARKLGFRNSALLIFKSGHLPLFLVDYLFQHTKCTKMQLALHDPGM